MNPNIYNYLKKSELLLSHCADEQAETRRGQVTWLMLHGLQAIKPEFDPGLFHAQTHAFNTMQILSFESMPTELPFIGTML